MFEGKVHAALRYISRDDKGGILSLDDRVPINGANNQPSYQTTRSILMDKHPAGRSAHSDILLPPEADSSHDSIIFEQITGEAIKQAAFRTRGAAVPSGVDAHLRRRLCSSFKRASNDLCSALAAVARRLCSTPVHPDGLFAFVACRLIPLNKNPGVRPIGIGEVPRRIIAKAILKVVANDVQSAAGHLPDLCRT